jgi:hypothetical protein
MLFAVGIAVAAIPEALVFTVTVVSPPNAALAPLAGAVNVTATPEAGLDDPSRTRA